MKPLLGYSFILLLMLGVIEVPTAAQNRRRRGRPQPRVTKTNNVQAVEILEEKDKALAECELANKPKPEAEIKVVLQLCGKAISLPKPPYPEEAKAMKVSGLIKVDVVIDEKGRVIWAEAVAGPPLLQNVSKKAACQARYSPTLISGRAVKTETSITYSFLAQ